MKNNEKNDIISQCCHEVCDVGWQIINSVVCPMCMKIDMDKVGHRTEQGLIDPLEKFENQMKSMITSRMVESQSGV